MVNVPGGTAQTGSLLVPPATRAHVYDLDGNLENDGLWKYGWDAENRLVAMENVTTLAATARRRVTFEYDDRSRRIGKKVYPWSGSGYAAVPTLTAKYLYDGWNLVAELDGANQPVRTYTWGNDLSGTSQGAGGVGGLLKVTSYTYSPSIVTHLLPVYDGNGNVTGLVDANARMVAATYEYGPFGELLRASGPQARSNPLRFSTKYQDDETELSYYGYRYYSANLGRWINRDPSEEQNGDSLYSFVGNDAVGRTDVLGLYQGDFHFYIIYYLLRAKGFVPDVAYDIAFGSQSVDDNPWTNPIELGKRIRKGDSGATEMLQLTHFAGSGPNTATVPGESSAIANAQIGLSQWYGSSGGDAFGTGFNLHTLADTWSHRRFTAHRNQRLNGKENHQDQGSESVRARFFVGYIGHAVFEGRPDEPFRAVQPAINAARTIYSLIPTQGCNPMSWDVLEGDLRAQFSVGGTDETLRRRAASQMIQRRFHDSFSVWYISPWPDNGLTGTPEPGFE